MKIKTSRNIVSTDNRLATNCTHPHKLPPSPGRITLEEYNENIKRKKEFKDKKWVSLEDVEQARKELIEFTEEVMDLAEETGDNYLERIVKETNKLWKAKINEVLGTEKSKISGTKGEKNDDG